MEIVDIDPNDPHQDFSWSVAGKEILRLSAEGFFVEGRKVTDDAEVYRLVKLWVEQAWAMKTAAAVAPERNQASVRRGAMPFCRNRRRVEVQRWPAVPTAPNTTARSVRCGLASSITMMMFLPPISSEQIALRSAQADATRRPVSVEPVNEIKRREL